MKRIITESWYELSGSLSYARHWIERFLVNNRIYKDLCVILYIAFIEQFCLQRKYI
jgi:hypothetical protein